VTGVTLAADAVVSLPDVVAIVKNLTQLQSLALSRFGLSGLLEDANYPSLADLLSLRHLDLCHNPRITGALPSSWHTMVELQTLNILHTGVSGPLPEAYPSLQQLREFKAVNCTGISGQLPATWGLLNLKVLEVTNSGLTGSLPKEWADAGALQRARAAAAAAAADVARSITEEMSAMTAAAPAQEWTAAGRTSTTSATTSAQLSADQPGLLVMLQLRVLDLSMLGASKGGLTGTLPGSFANMQQLQVGVRTC
jgi:hypothetical protein